MDNTLYIVVPCYNEEEVLPETSRRLREKLEALMAAGKISDKSRVLFVNDGSRDRTWELICLAARGVPAVLRGGSVPQPGPSERPAGGADDRQGAVRHGHLHGRRPPGRRRRGGRHGGAVLRRVRHRLRRALRPEEGHLLQALHRRGVLPADELHGGGDGVQPRRLPPHVPPGPGGAGPVQGGQPLPPGHRAHDRLPHPARWSTSGGSGLPGRASTP